MTSALSKTQHNATLVRALFRQLCAAVSHPATAKGATLHCPANFGIAYLGTFYDGSRTLANWWRVRGYRRSTGRRRTDRFV